MANFTLKITFIFLKYLNQKKREYEQLKQTFFSFTSLLPPKL